MIKLKKFKFSLFKLKDEQKLGKSMSTIYEIAQHVITGKPYEEKPSYTAPSECQESLAYQLLTKETTPEVINKVRAFVSGKLSQVEIQSQINSKSAYSYLAAAKIVDLDTLPSEMIQSTYKVREIALLRSISEKEGRGAINMLNAFSTPPLNKANLDILLANELDSNHPIVNNAAVGKERDNHLNRIYTYCESEAKLIPELIPVIEAVIKDRFQIMIKIDQLLPNETTVIFKGCSGAGKSFALKEFIQQFPVELTVDKAVQSTDNIKNDIKLRTGKVFNDQHAFLLGFATFKMLIKVMKDTYPKLSTLQEGCFNSTFTIEKLFKDNMELKLEVRDFDGDAEALLLRVLARYQDPNSPKPTLAFVERTFKTSRESRGLLLHSLRKTDSYQFRFVHKNGLVDEKIDPRSITSDAKEVNAEIEAAKKMEITEQHVQLFGESLNKFVGMTIEKAFEQVNGF
jgi:hypothetical protein